MRNYSVQQIKFEFLSYLKEFGSNGAEWHIHVVAGADDDPSIGLGKNDNGPDIWIRKPAINERAASIIKDYMVRRFGVNEGLVDEDKIGATEERNWVYMFKGNADDLAA